MSHHVERPTDITVPEGSLWAKLPLIAGAIGGLGTIATVGMMLGYRLEAPTPDETAGLGDLPEPLRPFAELEARVPGSFYVNALAVFDAYRDSGIGTRLLQAAAGRATALGCPRLSLMVFSQLIRLAAV